MTTAVKDGGERRVVVDAENPWPGLDYFAEQSQAFFHGREAESDLLLSMVRHRLLTVLYGQSGLGKSSLLQAGLFPRLRADGWLPVYIRLSHTDADGLGGQGPGALVAQAKHFVREAIRQAIEEGHLSAESASGDGETVSPFPRDDESLWEYVHRRDSGLRSATRERVAPVLVFDQFEEIFTLGRNEARLAIRQTFLRDLANCVENRLPEYVLKEMNRRDRTTDPFAHLEFTRQDYRIVLSLREDYLAELHDLDELMPSIHENETRLLPLNGWQALDAVAIPGENLVEPVVAREIVELVAASRRGDAQQNGAAEAGSNGEVLDESQLQVDPALLSMVCRELNMERQRRKLPKITQEITNDLLRNSDRSILRRFYTDCFRSLPDQESASEVQKFIEDELLTPTGYRNMAELERAQHRLKTTGVRDPAAAFQQLVDERLLRINERPQDKTRWLELTHDVLCDVVKESRHEREVREAKEREEREETERATRRLREAEEQRARAEAEAEQARQREAEALADLKQAKRMRRLGIAAMVLSVGLVAALILAGLLAKSWYEAGKKGRDRSIETTKHAQERINRADDDRQNANALRLLARALRLDPNNREAARITCELLMQKKWLPPISLPLRYTETESSLLAAAFSPDGRWIVAVAQNGTLVQWDTENFEQAKNPLQLLPDKPASPELISSAAFSRDGKRILLTLNPAGRENARVCNWSEPDRAYRADVTTLDFKDSIRSLAWSADGTNIFVLPQRMAETNCRVFRFEGTSFREQPPIPNTIAVDLSPDDKVLATAAPGGKVYLWDVETLSPVAGTMRPVLEPPSSSGETRYTSLIFSRNGHELAATSFREPTRVWDVRTGEGKMVKPKSVQDRVMRVAFAPPGAGREALALAVSGTMGAMVTLVDPLRPEQRLAEPICFTEGFVYPTFREDGKVLVTLSGAFWQALDTVRVWDLTTSHGSDDAAAHRFSGNSAPVWLSELADTVAGVVPHRDDKEWPIRTLSELKKKYGSDPGPKEYAPVWERFIAPAR